MSNIEQNENFNSILTEFLTSKTIRIIEDEIIWTMKMREMKKHNNNINAESLLRTRKKLINDFVLNYQKELLPVILVFNENLTKNIRKLYDKAESTYKLLLPHNNNNDFTVEGVYYFDGCYPKKHPVQDNMRQELWEALTDEDNNPGYNYSVTKISFHKIDRTTTMPSLNEAIYLDKTPQNWNEGLDGNLTKDLHLIYPFHDLFEHSNFALTDFIYCQDFIFEIKCDINIFPHKKR